MRRFLKITITILQWICYIYCMVMGTLNSPTWFGANHLFLAMFLTPRPIVDHLERIPEIRWVLLFLAFVAIHFTPMEDVTRGAEYSARKILYYRDLFLSLLAFFQ